MDTVEVESSADSPLAIEGIDLGITTDEIIDSIAEASLFWMGDSAEAP
ncbi:MAG: hypothetical protein M9941_09485 [Anaerolineae bacterium]|nr:hypothetical protein [Anaerolineae bacterium]MCO5197958.1 hypothetical protein [Anaerolineae bacterium]